MRAGQGHSFLLRRLHSLTGIIPVGAFLFEHILISNATATGGPAAYARQVRFLGGLPFVTALEFFGIWLPIAFHALYGFYIWWRGESNVKDYPWAGNWLFTAQRYTGIIAFIYIAMHTYDMRFTGVHLFGGGHIYAFGKVHAELKETGEQLFYALGIVAASWHFAYGLWLFAAKWGIFVGDKARRRFGLVCLLVAVVFIAVGTASMVAFLTTPPAPPPSAENALLH